MKAALNQDWLSGSSDRLSQPIGRTTERRCFYAQRSAETTGRCPNSRTWIPANRQQAACCRHHTLVDAQAAGVKATPCPVKTKAPWLRADPLARRLVNLASHGKAVERGGGKEQPLVAGGMQTMLITVTGAQMHNLWLLSPA